MPRGAREVMTQKRDCAGSRRSAHSYSFRVIAEHEARVLHLLLSRGMGEQERRLCARYSDAMRLVNTCRIDGWWVSALRMLGILPPTLPETSPNFPQRAVLSPGKRTDRVAQHIRCSHTCSDDQPPATKSRATCRRPGLCFGPTGQSLWPSTRAARLTVSLLLIPSTFSNSCRKRSSEREKTSGVREPL